MTADEQYLQDALRDRWATKQDVPMRTIGTPDTSLQARVIGLNPAHVERLREALRDQGSLKPVAIFRETDSRKVWLADGFHRHEAYRLEGREAIPAYLIEGGKREALKFATMCNRENCLGRTKADIKKAAHMLLADREWWRKTDVAIAEHLGVERQTLHRWRLEYSHEKGKELPEEVVASNGRLVRAQRHPTFPVRRSLTIESIDDLLLSRGIKSDPLGNHPNGGLGSGRIVFGVLVVAAELSSPIVLATTVGRTILNRVKHLPDCRAIVVCYDPPQCEALNIAREKLGIEFVAPEELVESLKGAFAAPAAPPPPPGVPSTDAHTSG